MKLISKDFVKFEQTKKDAFDEDWHAHETFPFCNWQRTKTDSSFRNLRGLYGDVSEMQRRCFLILHVNFVVHRRQIILSPIEIKCFTFVTC